MSLLPHLLQHASHHIAHEAVSHFEKDKRRKAESKADAEREAARQKKKRLIKEIQSFIELDIPIPKEYKRIHPDSVVEAALEFGRQDLVVDMLPSYEERKRDRLAAHETRILAERQDRLTLGLAKFALAVAAVILVYFWAIR